MLLQHSASAEKYEVKSNHALLLGERKKSCKQKEESQRKRPDIKHDHDDHTTAKSDQDTAKFRSQAKRCAMTPSYRTRRNPQKLGLEEKGIVRDMNCWSVTFQASGDIRDRRENSYAKKSLHQSLKNSAEIKIGVQ